LSASGLLAVENPIRSPEKPSLRLRVGHDRGAQFLPRRKHRGHRESQLLCVLRVLRGESFGAL